MLTNRKNCISCKRKREVKEMEIIAIQAVNFGIYACKDKPTCLHYQLKQIKKK